MGAMRPLRSATDKQPRDNDSWRLAVEWARSSLEGLTGGPDVRRQLETGERMCYSVEAAAVILGTAVALWPNTAALLAAGDTN